MAATARDELSKHLSAAIELEERGIALYSRYASESTTSFGEMLFKRLAEDEEQHRESLIGIKAAYTTKKTAGAADKLIPIDHKDIFSPGSRKPSDITKEYLTALAYAIDVEEKSYLFYTELSEMATDATLKKLFRELSNIEKGHIEIIRDEIDFAIQNPMLM
jgi:rubrerythrin